MSSRTKRIGNIGEQAIITELLQYPDIIVSKPITDNEPYDIIIDYKGVLYRVQIKTTEFVKDNTMCFCTSITNPFKRTNKKYTDQDIDMFMLYCLENKYCGLLLISEYITKDTVLRINPTISGQVKGIKYAEDYELHKRLSELLDKDKISKIDPNNKVSNVEHITDNVMAYLEEHTYKETEKHFDISHDKIIECRKYHKKVNQNKEKSISRSSNAITLFSGCDCVCIVNGKIIGEITGFRKHLNNDLNGNIDISFVRFDKEIIFPENTLFVAVYANEHGNAAYEVFHLNKITDIKSSIRVDTIVPYVHERYSGKLVLPLNPLPDEVVNMTNEDFENMINRVRNKCNHKEWLKFVEHPINHLTNRTYIWVLDNMFTSEQN